MPEHTLYKKFDLRSCPLVILRASSPDTSTQVNSKIMDKFSVLILDWLVDAKDESGRTDVQSLMPVLESRLMENLGLTPPPLPLRESDVVSHMLRALDDITPLSLVSATPIEDIGSKADKTPFNASVNLSMSCSLMHMTPERLNERIEEDIVKYYRCIKSAERMNDLREAVSIFENLSGMKTRDDIEKILNDDFKHAITHHLRPLKAWINENHDKLISYVDSRLQSSKDNPLKSDDSENDSAEQEILKTQYLGDLIDELRDLPIRLNDYQTLGGFEELSMKAKNQKSNALLSVLYDHKIGQINYKKRESSDTTFGSIVSNYHRFRLEQDKQYIQDKSKYS